MWSTVLKYFHYLDVHYGPSSLAQYVGAFLFIFITLVTRFVVCSIVYHKLESWVNKKSEKHSKIISSFRKPLGYLILLTGLYLACQVLTWPNPAVFNFISVFFSTMITVSFAWMAIRSVDILSLYLRVQAEKTENRLDDQLVPLISKSLKIFIAVVAFALVISNLGYSISGLLAGLGIGGIAIAMAAKDSLANLFGSLTIFLDNPFQVGDWIKAGKVEGTVEFIGFRSTRIRTFYKTEVSLPNNSIANTTIDNFSRMKMRRISTTLNFTYETTAEQMEKAIEAIKEILRNDPGVYQDFFLVNFTEFSSSSLDVMLYYFTNTINWQEYLEIRQGVNLKIMKAMASLGVNFAFQSMSVYLKES